MVDKIEVKNEVNSRPNERTDGDGCNNDIPPRQAKIWALGIKLLFIAIVIIKILEYLKN